MSLENKKNAWAPLADSLQKIYVDVLQQYWSSLNDFYAFFGHTDFGQAKVSDLGPDATAEEIKTWTASNDLAYKLNFLKKEVFEKVQAAEQGKVYTLSGKSPPDQSFLSDFDPTPWPTVKDLDKDSFHQNTLAPLVNQLVQDFKVILENPLIASVYDDHFAFGQAPNEDAVTFIEEAIAQASEYLVFFPEYSITLKKDIKPLPETTGKASTPIFSDINLENSLNIDPGYTHYIGINLRPLMTGLPSHSRYSSPYIPVRYAPFYDPNVKTWDDQSYSLVELYRDQESKLKARQVKTDRKDSRGITMSLGHGVIVTEIVESETGTWVGFVSDKIPSAATDSNKKVLYTKAEYIRIRESAINTTPDPYLSRKILSNNPFLDSIGDIANIKGAKEVNPKENQNWVSLNPLDIRIQRYDFSDHNDKLSEDDTNFSEESILKNSSLRYSHGEYYFVRGEIPRQSEEEIFQNNEEDLESNEKALEEKKKEISAAAMNALKREAWKNLLNYLNKHHDLEGNRLQEQLFNNYFVVAAAKINTKSVNPNNQKVLFAIRANYVDALPEKAKLYMNDFNENEKDFAAGNNFAVTIRLREFKLIVDNLKSKFEDIKSKIRASNTKVQNPNNIDYDVSAQIEFLEDLPNIFNRFFDRQYVPASTNADFLSQMMSEGTETTDNHIIEIGIKDNGAVGAGVRETISYVLFSPDPKRMLGPPLANPDDLFYFDPFLTEEELNQGPKEMRRSAIALRIGMPLLREEFEGVHGSRALHLLFSYNGFKGLLKEKRHQDKWTEFLHNYSVPPLKIFPSLDPTKVEDSEALDCEEILRKLNNSSAISGKEEQRLQELLAGPCSEKINSKKYWNTFKDGTPATDPSFSKENLQKIAENNKKKNSSSVMQNEYVKVLYTGFFNSLDPSSLISLIMACIQKKLGIPLTAEAICEAAIVELVKSLGIDQVEQIIIANALLSPGSELSINALNALDAGPGKDSVAAKLASGDLLVDPETGTQLTPTDLDYSWNDAPVATALVVAGSTESAAVLEAIKDLEKSGQTIQLVPGKRKLAENEIAIPYGPSNFISNLIPDAYTDEEGNSYVTVPEFYTQDEIDEELEMLMGQGYSKAEAEAELVATGVLVITSSQYEALLTGEAITAPLENLAASVGGELGQTIRATTQDAENWLTYMRNAVSLGGLCELIVGEILEGLEDLIRDPGSFSFGDWGASLTDRLKRRFSAPSPTMRFPDNLMTDSHMDDWGKRLFKTIVAMVGSILGQIVELLIRQALEECLEESHSRGPQPPIPSSTPPIPLPEIQRANLPEIGEVARADIAAWVKDLMDNLTVEQLCALLRGDATKQTLYDCLVRTRNNWPLIVKNNADNMGDIATTFKMLGQTLNLEICNLIQSIDPVEDLCEAVFDYDTRCAQLKSAGLTEEECQKQINEELNDLKSKVSGMVPLLFNQTNPLSAIPSMCEVEGAFQVPASIADTMERVTDNILDFVKGSLIEDLSSLKFFSVPPRAILALGDPKELEKAHNIFMDIDLKPDTALRVATVVPGIEFFNSPAGISQKSDVVHNKVYPLVYNGAIHYGGHSTLRWYYGTNTKEVNPGDAQFKKWISVTPTRKNKKYVGGENDVLIEDAHELFDGISPAHGHHYAGAIANVKNWVPPLIGIEKEGADPVKMVQGSSVVDYAKTDFVNLKWETEELLKDYFPSSTAVPTKSVQYSNVKNGASLEDEKILPITVLSCLKQDSDLPDTPENYNKLMASFYDRSSEIINALKAFMTEEKLVKPEDASAMTKQQVISHAQFHLFELRDRTIEIMNSNQTRPVYIETLLIKPEDVINFNKGEGISALPGPLYNRSKYGPTTTKSFLTPDTNTMKTVWSLNTKLREVRNEAMSWYPMIQLFTGINILHWNDKDGPNYSDNNWLKSKEASSSDTNDHGNNYHAFPEQILGYPDAVDIGAPNSIKDSPNRPYSAVDPEAEILDGYNYITYKNSPGGRRHWFPWLNVSPGLLKLFRIAQKRKSGTGTPAPPYSSWSKDSSFESGGGSWPISRAGYKPWGKGGKEVADGITDTLFPEIHSVADAFMELTVEEALGLSQKRIKQIMPNLNVSIKGVIFGEGTVEANLIGDGEGHTGALGGDSYSPERDIKTPVGLATGLLPFYIVYEEQVLAMPSNKLADLVDHSKMDKDKVNQELYDALNNSAHFLPSAGLELSTLDQENKDFNNIDKLSLFNPNTLLYPLPFTDVVNKNVDGQIDGAAKTKEILDIFKEGFQDSGLQQASELLAKMETATKNASILYQNTLVPSMNNATKQLDEIKDVLTIVKGKINLLGGQAPPPWPFGPPPVPADVIKNESQIQETKYMLNHKKHFDKDISELMRNVYGSDFNYNKLRAVWKKDYEPIVEAVKGEQIDLLPKMNPNSPEENPVIYMHNIYHTDLIEGKGPYKLDPFNFKAQMFGELLTHKFMKAYEKYRVADPSFDSPPPITKEQFAQRLKYVLATYGYSALQYAYSSQMFTKLKHSRLHTRGFMKKLWNAILKSPLTSDVDPRCQQALEEMSLIPKSDLDETETDFFNLSKVKSEIKDIYMRSLCADVYEKKQDAKQYPGLESLGSAQISLLEGSAILLIKVYILEMCLASVIAWDSFDLIDVLQDELIVEIVCENITKDEHNLDLISYFCNDIIRKRKNMTDVEKYKSITSEKSALKYIIEEEAAAITAAVKKIFKFSNPIKLDLSLNVLKNSDTDFKEAFANADVISGMTKELVQKNSMEYSSLYENTKMDYVVAADLPDNAYTMNYGDGRKIDFLPLLGTPNNLQSLSPTHTDIFGYFASPGKYNKNLFHSLPMTQYTGDGYMQDDSWITQLPGGNPNGTDSSFKQKEGDNLYNASEFNVEAFLADEVPVHEASSATAGVQGSPRDKMVKDEQFMKYSTLQRLSLGGADPWHKENFQESLFGGMLNAKLGNITINPYVRIEIEMNCEDYNFAKLVAPLTDEPCDTPDSVKVDACSDTFAEARDKLHAYMEDNIFNCHIDGYVPLSVWSYFYNNIFLEIVNNTPLLRDLYDHFGFKPWFKEVNFGLRLSYATSFPVFQAEDLKFTEFMQNAFPYNYQKITNPSGLNGLKKVKSLFGIRPHQSPSEDFVTDADTSFEVNQAAPTYKLVRELQVPIAEVERSIICQEGTGGFTIGASDEITSMDELGYYFSGESWTNLPSEGQVPPAFFLSGDGLEIYKFLIKTPDQFFYKNLASELLVDLKNTPEFRLMFDHLFPMRKYMALSFVYAGEGLSKFIAEPTDVLDLTKASVTAVWENLMNSADYKHLPASVTNMMEDYLVRSQGGTRGKEPDMTKQILEIIYKTPLLILKGLVETTDPAVAIAKTIIDIAQAVQQATISAIEQALKTAEQIAQAAVDAAKAAMNQIKVKAGIDLTQAIAFKAAMPLAPVELLDSMIIDNTDPELENWIFSAPSSIDEYAANMTDMDKQSWIKWKEKFDNLKSFQADFAEANKKLDAAQAEVDAVKLKINTTLKDAKETMSDIFDSPYMLPGLWFSLLPSMFPYGGGIIPLPFIGGPPSTFPGMIYIALLLIDAMEEKIDDDLQKAKKEPNCDNEL